MIIERLINLMNAIDEMSPAEIEQVEIRIAIRRQRLMVELRDHEEQRQERGI